MVYAVQRTNESRNCTLVLLSNLSTSCSFLLSTCVTPRIRLHTYLSNVEGDLFLIDHLTTIQNLSSTKFFVIIFILGVSFHHSLLHSHLFSDVAFILFLMLIYKTLSLIHGWIYFFKYLNLNIFIYAFMNDFQCWLRWLEVLFSSYWEGNSNLFLLYAFSLLFIILCFREYLLFWSLQPVI